ncbi:GEVED domain-containing protein [uncultured Draconibacterium sp.]|uniref:GEVED domain-containing protein n=1 Tax=uncultured Draconibacterium sp. TaxID=1573823 RepID=UPI0025E90F2D|nr:GEVED domain-containing protein [uncultured Draconibacterium sp.]
MRNFVWRFRSVYFLKYYILISFTFLYSSVTSKIYSQPIASWNYSIQTGNIGTNYNWIDCTSGISIVSGDDVEGSFTWPFAFKYYDNIYTTANRLSVTTNGFIRFDGVASVDDASASDYNLTSTSISLGQILALAVYDNKVGDNGGFCKYLVTGAEPNRILTLEFNNIEIDFKANRYATVQVSFYETSNKIVIKFGTENINKKGVDIGLHSGVSGYFNKWGEVKGFAGNTWIEYTPLASLIVSPSVLAFGFVDDGGISSEQIFTVTGIDLGLAPGYITVNAPANFEVSLSSGSGFGKFVDIPYSSSGLATINVYVRFTPTSTDVDYSQEITVSGGGANTQIVTATGTSIPPGYCTFTFNTVKTITGVEFSTLNNTNNSTNSYEDFTTTVSPGMIFTGGTYSITIQGEADTWETLYYSVFFDWNHDGDFTDAGESFPIGTISDSNGNDGKYTDAQINVPTSGIALGNTRMRIIGDNEGYSTNPCSRVKNKSNGQIHDYTVLVSKPAFVWQGTVDSDWENSSNWSHGVVPGSNDEVTIPDMVSSGNWPVITEAVGTIKNLNLESTASGTGSVIINGGSLIVSGNVQVGEFVPSDDWHIISSPVSGQELGSFAASNNLGFYDGAYDIAPYSEINGDWGPFDVVSATSTQFGSGNAYLSRLPVSDGNRVIYFQGISIHSGTITRSISYSTAPSANGWNSIGNPYTSSLKATGTGSFLEANVGNIHPDFAGIYVWNKDIWDYDTYSAVTPMDISLGQGFVIKSKTGGGTIQFTPSMQIHSNVALKSTEKPQSKIKLKIWSTEAENSTIIYFGDNMTKGFDKMYDISKLKGNPDIALYTKLPEDNMYELAIQALPNSAMDETIIPVGVDCWLGGEYEFMADCEGIPGSVDIVFEDRKEKKSTILNTRKSHYYTILEEGETGAERFFLIIKSSTTNVKSEINQKPFKVFTSEKVIFINGPFDNSTTLCLYSADGKLWKNKKAEDLSRNKIDASYFPAGIYFLKIDQSGRQQTEKLILMR